MKTIEYLKFNGRIVRENGNSWKVIANKFGIVRVLVECFYGKSKGQTINLIAARSNRAKDIKFCLEHNLVS